MKTLIRKTNYYRLGENVKDGEIEPIKLRTITRNAYAQKYNR